MLQEVPGINLASTKTAPGTECSAEFFKVLQEQLEVASSEIGVQLRKVQLERGAENLREIGPCQLRRLGTL